MSKKEWTWQPHAGHFILGDKCQFTFNTYLGNGYLVSTIGELWNEESVRRIHAKIHNPSWYIENNSLEGDNFDREYMKEFGFEDIGFKRKYETMVFRAKKSKHDCCPYEMQSADNVDFNAYNSPREAREGHMRLCKKWSKKHNPKETQDD